MSATENDAQARLTPIAAAARLIPLDRRFAAGALLGLTLLAGGYALSQNGLTQAFTRSSDPKSELLSDQISVIAQAKIKEAEECATGTVEGTVGYAINISLKAHLEMASAMPNVEKLFDVNKDCFSGLSSLIDLSFAIPSLATIIAAAQAAVMEYAKKKICSAVAEVTTMVTSPINQAIGTINGIAGFGNLNGLTAGLGSPGGMTMVDANLGAAYNVGTSGTYQMTDRFNNRGQASTDGTNNGGTTQADYERVQTLNTQLGNLQAQLGPARQEAQQAQSRLDACGAAGGGECASLQAQAAAAQTNVTNIQNQITSVQNQINTLLGQTGMGSGGTAGAGGSGSTGGAGGQQQPVLHKDQQQQPQQKSLTQRLTGLFQ